MKYKYTFYIIVITPWNDSLILTTILWHVWEINGMSRNEVDDGFHLLLITSSLLWLAVLMLIDSWPLTTLLITCLEMKWMFFIGSHNAIVIVIGRDNIFEQIVRTHH